MPKYVNPQDVKPNDVISFKYKIAKRVCITAELITGSVIAGKLSHDYKGKNEFWEAGETKYFNISEMKDIKIIGRLIDMPSI